MAVIEGTHFHGARRFTKSGDWWRHGLLWIISLFLLAPFVVAILISVKSPPQFASNPFGLTWPLDLQNYQVAGGFIWRSIVNSIIISGVTCVGVVIIGGMAAYAFARLDFPGKRLLYYAVLGLIMIPGILTLVPSFIVVNNLHLLNTWLALIFPWIAGGQVFAIFILRTFFEQMPGEMFDSARVDGASEFTIVFRIVLPLSRAILGVVAIFNILSTWNDFIWPLVVIRNQDLAPLLLRLFSFQASYVSAWGLLMAGYVIGTIPLMVLFAFTSRLFVRGLAAGAIKM